MTAWLRHNSLISLTAILIVTVHIVSICNQEKWRDSAHFFAGDIRGYYMYLPAFFINDDLTLQKQETFVRTEEGESLVWYVQNEQGKRFIKYPAGLAISMTPAFLIAHYLAGVYGYETNGYSEPYMIALTLNSIVFSLIAMIFIVKLLRNYFPEYAIITTLLILFLGSNAYHYYTGTLNYSHTYSLTFISAYLYYVDRWIRQPNNVRSVLIGVLFGMIVLIRPIDIVLILVPLFYRVNSGKELMERLRFLVKSWRSVALILSFFFMMLSIQLSYNLIAVGELFHYSYGKERMFLDHPRIGNVLFDFRNGWLIYSPLMMFSLFGFIFIRGAKRTFGIFSGIPIVVYLYLISTWWCWWYMGFGNRAVINIYPLLALPLALFIETVGRKLLSFILLNVLVILGLILSIFQTYQYDKGLIHWGAMTKEAYAIHFLELEPHQKFSSLLRFPVDSFQFEGINAVYEPNKEISYRLSENFNSSGSIHSSFREFRVEEQGVKETSCAHLKEGQEFLGPGIPIPRNFESLEVYARVKSKSDSVHLTISSEDPFFYQASNEVKSREGQWRELYMFCWVPDYLDTVKFVIWNQAKEEVLIDDIKIIGKNHGFYPKILD